MKKIKIREDEAFCCYNLESSIKNAVKWLNQKLKDGWETMDIDFENHEVWFTRTRMETDEEFEKRKQRIQKQNEDKAKVQAEKEKEERLLYKKLKKKFEKCG